MKFSMKFYIWNKTNSPTLLSKLNYCDTVFYPLPDFLFKHLQRLQFAAASFILGRYVNTTADILKLAWLPLKELRDYSLLKCVYRAIYFDNWPVYLKLQIVQPVRNLRSTIAPRLVTPLTQIHLNIRLRRYSILCQLR